MSEKSIVPFHFESNEIRTVIKDREPWFVAKDVCDVLEIKNVTQAVASLDDDERSMFSIGRQGDTNICSESGLYALIFKSRKPEAKRFRKWVTAEVLPTLRKTGIYSVPGAPTEAMQLDMMLADAAARMLRLNDGSKANMLSKIAINHGRPTNFLPAYVEEQETRSLTTLLKEYGAPFGAKKAYLILIDKGLIEIKSRPSTKGNGIKYFKSLTDSGLKYGKNLISPNNQRETQPHFFVDTFEELLSVISLCK